MSVYGCSSCMLGAAHGCSSCMFHASLLCKIFLLVITYISTLEQRWSSHIAAATCTSC